MANGDIWRMDEAAGGPAQQAVIEVTTTSGKKAFAHAALAGGGGGAGTEYTEDAAAPANPVGGIVQLRRRDTPTVSEVSNDGDIIAANATSKGELRVNDADQIAAIGTGNTALASLDTKTPAVGQTTMAGSRPVVLASNHSNIPVAIQGTLPAFAATPTFNIGTAPTIAVTGTFWQATQPVSGTITANLGTLNGAALDASVTAMSAKLPAALGQATRANSMSVTIASDQTDVPVAMNDVVVNATTITTQNLVPAGAATAGSAVAITPAGRAGLTIQVTGVYTGALSLQGTVDGTNWITIGGTSLINVATGASSATIASGVQGIFQTEISGFNQVRLTALAAVTGTATVTLRASEVASAFSITDPLPTGTNSIGAVTIGSGTVTTVSTVTNVASIASANLGAPLLVADVASAALTTTTTTATFTPTAGVSYEINIPVTAVSGTTPTLDIVVQESDDSGTNWFDVYHFPRITATGIYRSPKMALTGNRVRYVQTVGGTTPSFTRSINRLQCSDVAATVRRTFDRSFNSTQTLGQISAVTLQGPVGGAVRPVAIISVSAGAITTTAPAFQMQGSDDGGVSWFNIGTPLTAVASSTVQGQTQVVNLSDALRAICSTAGSEATLNYVQIRSAL